MWRLSLDPRVKPEDDEREFIIPDVGRGVVVRERHPVGRATLDV